MANSASASSSAMGRILTSCARKMGVRWVMQGVRTVVGKVVCPNEKSDHLHEKMGFELVGTLRAASWKLGVWHDVHLWERHIGDVEAEPTPLLRLSEVDSEKVRAILEA